MDITMQDVEIAIKVLNEFIRRTRQAQITLRRMEVSFKGSMDRMPQTMQDFMNLALQTAQAKKRGIEEGEAPSEMPPPTEEELKRMREIADKTKHGAT